MRYGKGDFSNHLVLVHTGMYFVEFQVLIFVVSSNQYAGIWALFIFKANYRQSDSLLLDNVSRLREFRAFL